MARNICQRVWFRLWSFYCATPHVINQGVRCSDRNLAQELVYVGRQPWQDSRLSMCQWDRTWAAIQNQSGLIVSLFCRYVDDLRLYLRPISQGWEWTHDGWKWKDVIDTRTPYRRTLDEINKCLNDVWCFLEFTVEGEEDFADKFLPTLDFSTHVLKTGYVSYKFFNKPMSSNIVLQNGTALSRECVFSSLRQEIVRRLGNCDKSMGKEYRIKIVEDLIQLLVNSGHKFTYIKSVILQGVTKFVYMLYRNNLTPSDKVYSPLHRLRTYKEAKENLQNTQTVQFGSQTLILRTSIGTGGKC